MTRRFARDTVLAVLGLAMAAVVWRPESPRMAAGVVGGGALILLAMWALSGLVHALGGPESGGKRPISYTWLLVKIFTRHAILALAAYGMMARLEFHPVGMLIGVSSVVVAAAAEAARWTVRA